MRVVVVGSHNPTKLESVKRAFSETFLNEDFSFVTYPAESGVADQPFGVEETKQGAYNRALACKGVKPQADFWIGLEGGIEIISDAYFVSAWMCVLGKNDQVGYGRTGAFALPAEVSERIKSGEELGQACDFVFSRSGSGHQGGAVGILTDEKISRADFYVPAIMFALIPFIKSNLYT